MTAPATITETLAAHRLIDYGECSCGWAPTSYRFGEDRSVAHRAHLADVLLPVLAEVVRDALLEAADEMEAAFGRGIVGSFADAGEMLRLQAGQT